MAFSLSGIISLYFQLGQLARHLRYSSSPLVRTYSVDLFTIRPTRPYPPHADACAWHITHPRDLALVSRKAIPFQPPITMTRAFLPKIKLTSTSRQRPLILTSPRVVQLIYLPLTKKQWSVFNVWIAPFKCKIYVLQGFFSLKQERWKNTDQTIKQLFDRRWSKH